MGKKTPLEKNDRDQKQKYEKPLLVPIELASEEVMVLGCKLTNGGFAFNHPVCTAATPCSAAGS